MTKQVFLEQFERRAVELSCPDRKLRKKIEELDVHHDFLKRTAQKQGVADFEAESQASRELGNPIALAEEASEGIRQASWWGRHPIIGYGMLPIALLGPAFVATVLIIALIIRLRFTNEQLQALVSNTAGNNPIKELRSIFEPLFGIHYVVLAMLPLPFTWMARRSASGLWWATLPCLICACQGMFLHLTLSTRGPRLGYGWDPTWIAGVGPMLIAMAEFVRQSLKLKQLEPLPASAHVKPAGLAALGELLNKPIGGESPRSKTVYTAHTAPVKEDWMKRAVRTPTYWVMAFVFVVLIPALLLGGFMIVRAQRNAARARTRTVPSSVSRP